MRTFSTAVLHGLLLTLGCASAPARDPGSRTDEFLSGYTRTWCRLTHEAALAQWGSNIRIVNGDTSTGQKSQDAEKQLAEFTGSKENIETARLLLKNADRLDRGQRKQLEKVLYLGANYPSTVPRLVEERIKAETEQTRRLFGFNFQLAGKSVTTEDLDDILRESSDLDERLEAWKASKEVGKELREGLVHLRDLRNDTVRDLGYRSYFQYQVSDYGMDVSELLQLTDRLVRELRPLYRELHTYARYELASKYGLKEVPDLLPAHWLPNRWAQDWSAMVHIPGIDLDAEIGKRGPEWVIRQAERFYVSLGFSPLPESFWRDSSLYPPPPGADYKKNSHASAWHLDYDTDIRCLMSVVPNREWYETAHHELGHIYYYISYSTPEIPPLLREGANRAFHEAIGSQLGMAALQIPFLEQLGLVEPGTELDEFQTLLQEALNHVVFIPFSAGTMTRFEHELYEQALPSDRFNARWWELARRYQGIVPPEPRPEDTCDAATKTHINDDPAQYYDYALSVVLLFQLHDHVAREILGQDPHRTNYYGSKEVGAFLRNLMSPGATRDWRELLRETVGQELSAEPMLRYFEPLLRELRVRNAGRKHTLPGF
jgi:peptidyl-dipeptidase A